MQPAPATSSLTALPAPSAVPVRRLVIALGLSAALHTTILFTTALRWQPVTPTSSLLNVVLVKGETGLPSTPALPAENRQKEDATLLAGASESTGNEDVTPPVSPNIEVVQSQSSRPERPAADMPDRFHLLALPPEKTSADDLFEFPFDIQLPGNPMPASLADLEYKVFSENQSGPTGRARYRYRILENGQYRLAYRESAIGAETSAGDQERWLGEVVGDVGPEGLQPQADDNPADPLTLGDSSLMSALFQFMHLPPGQPGSSGDMRIGDRTYRYEVIQPQTIETPSRGLLTTLQIRIQQLGLQTPAIEVWLAVDYRFLPVRIRMVDAHGKITLLRIERFTEE